MDVTEETCTYRLAGKCPFQVFLEVWCFWGFLVFLSVSGCFWMILWSSGWIWVFPSGSRWSKEKKILEKNFSKKIFFRNFFFRIFFWKNFPLVKNKEKIFQKKFREKKIKKNKNQKIFRKKSFKKKKY